MPTVYPVVPGHEIVGRVVQVGNAVKKFKEGDLAAVGCMVDSCRICANCRDGEEIYCDNGVTLTYNGEDKILGGVTYGGYSDSIVVDEAFVLRLSNNLDPAGAALLLCAGITTYSPLRHWKGRPRTEGRYRRSRRLGSYGREICARLRRPRCTLYHLSEQNCRRQAPRCGRCRHFEECRRNAETREQLRLQPPTPFPPTTT